MDDFAWRVFVGTQRLRSGAAERESLYSYSSSLTVTETGRVVAQPLITMRRSNAAAHYHAR